MGDQVFGSIYVLQLFGRYFAFASPGCKAFEFRVASTERPRAVIGHSASTRPRRTHTYQSYRLIVGSQCPGTSSSFSPSGGRALPSTQPCSSEACV